MSDEEMLRVTAWALTFCRTEADLLDWCAEHKAVFETALSPALRARVRRQAADRLAELRGLA